MDYLVEKALGTLKRWGGIVPTLMEIGLVYFVFRLIQALVNRKRNLRHSCYSRKDWVVDASREPPRDHLRDKFFQTPQGLWIHYRVWKQPAGLAEPKAMILLLHGMSEHIGRHEPVAEFYQSKGYMVFGMDHQGFGRSEGDRGHVESFDHYCDDILHFLGTVVPELYPELEETPKFVQGHSMGGLITVLTAAKAQESKNPWHKLTGIVGGNAALHRKAAPVQETLLTLVSYYDPKWQLLDFPSVKSMNFLPSKMQSQYDPVNYQAPLRVHHILEFLKSQDALPHIAKTLKTPVFLFHGVDDFTASIEGARKFTTLSKSNPDSDVTLYEIPGLWHEPLQEEAHVREPILKYIEHWVALKAAQKYKIPPKEVKTA